MAKASAQQKAADVHTWHPKDRDSGAESSEGYQAQMAMPVHLLVAPQAVEHDDGSYQMHHVTACGLILGEHMIRSTDITGDVTCPECEAKA